MMKILLDAGFDLNCKKNGGSPVLDVLLRGGALGFLTPSRPYGGGKRGQFADDRAREFIKTVEAFVDRGARWVPNLDDRNELKHVRDVFLALQEIHFLRLLGILETSEAVSREHLSVLLKAPRMRGLAQAIKLSKE